MTPSHAAAVCYRLTADGPRLLLITTSDGQRWIIPKGHIELNESSWSVVAWETLEETGWDGAIDRTSLGTFVYGAGDRRVLVEAFLLEATHRPQPGEDRRQVWLAPPDLPRLLRQGREDDPFTVAELLRVVHTGLAHLARRR